MDSASAPPIAAPLTDVDTDRLRLRRFASDDLDGLAAVFAHREVWEYPYGRSFTRDETSAFIDAQRRHWEVFGFGLWLAELHETAEVIGYVGLSVPSFIPELLPTVEVGWRFSPDHWGQGYATEAARAALDQGFSTLGLSEICSLPQTANPPSYRVCERLGMRLEGVVECPATDRRGAVDARHYVLRSPHGHRLGRLRTARHAPDRADRSRSA